MVGKFHDSSMVKSKHILYYHGSFIGTILELSWNYQLWFVGSVALYSNVSLVGFPPSSATWQLLATSSSVQLSLQVTLTISWFWLLLTYFCFPAVCHELYIRYAIPSKESNISEHPGRIQPSLDFQT